MLQVSRPSRPTVVLTPAPIQGWKTPCQGEHNMLLHRYCGVRWDATHSGRAGKARQSLPERPIAAHVGVRFQQPRSEQLVPNTLVGLA